MSRQAPASGSSTSAPSRVVPAPHYARLQHASGHVRPSVGYCVAGPQWQYVANHPVYPSVQPYAPPYVVQHPLAHPHHHAHSNPHAEPYVVRQPIFQPHYHPSVVPQGCVIAPTYVKPTTAVHRPSQQAALAAAPPAAEADNAGKQKITAASPKVDDDPAVIKILRREETKPQPEAKAADTVLPPQIIVTDKEPSGMDDAAKRTSTPSIISDDTGFDSASQKTSESGEDRNGDYLDIVHNLIEKIELDQGARKAQDNTEGGVPISIDNSYSNIQFSPNKAPSLFGRAFRLSGRCKPKKKSPVKRTKGFGAPPKTTDASAKNPDSDAKPSEDDSWIEGDGNPVLAYQITEPTFDFDRARQEAERRAAEREIMENDDAAPYHGKRWRRKSRQPNKQPPMYKAWQAFKKPFKNRNQSQRGDGDGYYGNPNGNKNFNAFWQRGRTRRRHNTFGSQRHLADQLKLHQDGHVRGTYSVDPSGACVNLNLNITIPNKKELVSAEADLDDSRVTIFDDDDEAEPEAPPMMTENIPSSKRRSRRTTSEPRRRKNSYLRQNGCEGARQPGHDDWDEWVHAGGMVSGKWGVVPRRERLRRTSSRNELWVDDNPSVYEGACMGVRQDALRKRQATGTLPRQRLGSNHA
ncbi:PREDICTED: uncharacterized protein LOC109462333 [Branchiostoma belcheri]|uniref:Uncharacterized protein LOC109462333 n=1 Tax=Branchiostoma belcheri TaxID=7741 RepID=A0A6P4XD15_BRABE|nr:PREDICTED: uncharacterized protein LOC109462333 [Branchiostoma belcheri]